MISMVEGAKRQKTPNEIALNILLAGMTIIFLLATVTLLPFSIYSVGALVSGLAPSNHFLGSHASVTGQGLPITVTVLGGLVGLFDPHDHRRFIARHWHCRDGPDDSGQRHRHVGPRGGGGGGRGRPAFG
jgi:hypothetical protein